MHFGEEKIEAASANLVDNTLTVRARTRETAHDSEECSWQMPGRLEHRLHRVWHHEPEN